MPGVKKGYSLVHAYKFYKKKTGSKITLQEYRRICYAYNKKLVELALSGRIVKLPFGIGDLWIKKIKTNWDNPRVDLNESKKRGKVIYHLNEHSEGWWARWYWSRNNSLITNVTFYSFQPSRENSRAVAAIMKQPDGHKRFFS